MNRRKRESPPDPPVWRSRCVIALFALAALALEARLGWLQLIESGRLTDEAEARQQRVVEMPAHRGRITDRFGEALAVSTPVKSIFVNPQEVPRDRDLIYELARLTGRDGEDLERDITSSSGREFLWVQRRMAPADADKALELGIPGVYWRREYRRYYPAGEATCQLLGLTNIDDVGTQGLELVEDFQLAGEPGKKVVQRDNKGRIIADVEEKEPVRPGRDLQTSIDERLQYLAYLELKAAIHDAHAGSGSIVILDPVTGEVLAMVNQPSCNPNDPAARSDMAAFRNRAITDPVEPGSTAKPLILATALAHGYTPDTLIDVPKDLYVKDDYVTSDSHRLGPSTVTEILARSSSVGMGLIGGTLESADIWGTLKAFGIAEATESGLGANESKGLLEDYRLWKPKLQATLSYGYGLSVTPLQLARAYAAIANGGLMPPISFEALDAPPKRVRAIEPEIAAELMGMLDVVVDTGTGRRADIPNYNVAGKTGTARMHTAAGYSEDRYRAIFAGIAPASHPRFVAVVVISDQDFEGGEVAAPVFSKVIGTALRLYGVKPDALVDPGELLISRAETDR